MVSMRWPRSGPLPGVKGRILVLVVALALAAGATAAGPVLAGPAGQGSTGALVAFTLVNGVSTVVTYDRATGAVAPIGACPGLFGTPQGVVALDTRHNRFFFILAERLLTVDTATGSTVTATPMQAAIAFQFDHETETLLGIVGPNRR